LVFDANASYYQIRFGLKCVGVGNRPFTKNFKRRKEIEAFIWPEQWEPVSPKLNALRNPLVVPVRLADGDDANKAIFKLKQTEIAAAAGAVQELLKYYSRAMVPNKLKMAVDYYIACHNPKEGLKSVREVISAAIQAKWDDGNEEVTIGEYQRRWNRFAVFAEANGLKHISQVERSDCEKFFDSLRLPALKKAKKDNRLRTGMTHKGKVNEVRNLSPLFSYAVGQGWMSENPLRGYSLKTNRQGIGEPPRILTVDEAAKLLKLAETLDLLSYVVLGMFCGLRPWEAERFQWFYQASHGAKIKTIRFEDDELYLPARWAKTKTERHVRLEPCASVWLKTFDQTKPIIRLNKLDAVGEVVIGKKGDPINDFRPRRELLRDQMGWSEWPEDILRHSYASYWLPLFHDTAKLTSYMGHRGTSMLFQHYRQSVSEKIAPQYWLLTPSNIRGEAKG
jgi:site-specific recombinase XerD